MNDLSNLKYILDRIEKDISGLKRMQESLREENNSQQLTIQAMVESINRLSSRNEENFRLLYRGTQGRFSLLEQIQVNQLKIETLEEDLARAEQDISILEQRWIKLLWTLGLTVGITILSFLMPYLQEGKGNDLQKGDFVDLNNKNSL